MNNLLAFFGPAGICYEGRQTCKVCSYCCCQQTHYCINVEWLLANNHRSADFVLKGGFRVFNLRLGMKISLGGLELRPKDGMENKESKAGQSRDVPQH